MPPLSDLSLRVLLALSRPVLPPGLQAGLIQWTPQLAPQAWQALARRAASDRTATWWLAHAQALDLAIPPQARKQLDKSARDELLRALACDQLLAALADVTQGQTAPALAFKGLAVERTTYPPALLRPRADLDLLVRPGHLSEVLAAAQRLGLRETSRSRSGHTRHLIDPHGGAALDLHLRPVDPWRFPRFAAEATTQAWFDRARPLSDPPLLVPDPIDHTALLLLHLVPGLLTSPRHLGDALHWLATIRPDFGQLAQRLHEWDAALPALAALQALDWAALGEPGCDLPALARRLGQQTNPLRRAVLPVVRRAGSLRLRLSPVPTPAWHPWDVASTLLVLPQPARSAWKWLRRKPIAL